LHIKFIFLRIFALQDSYLFILSFFSISCVKNSININFDLLLLTFFYIFVSSRANFIFLDQFNYVDDSISFANVYSNNLLLSLLIVAITFKICECKKNNAKAINIDLYSK